MLDDSILEIMQSREKSKAKPLTKIFQGAKAAPKKKSKTRRKAPKGTHRMSDGTLMSGSVHTADSKPIKATRKSMKGRGKRGGYSR